MGVGRQVGVDSSAVPREWQFSAGKEKGKTGVSPRAQSRRNQEYKTEPGAEGWCRAQGEGAGGLQLLKGW